MTLTEVMAVTLILGIMATSVTLIHLKAAEVGKRRAARDVLEAIYAGERVYTTLNKVYCTPNPSTPPPPADCTWSDIYVDDPSNVIQNVAFTVEVRGGGTEFDATATRTRGRCQNRTLTLDETRTESGDWPANGQC